MRERERKRDGIKIVERENRGRRKGSRATEVDLRKKRVGVGKEGERFYGGLEQGKKTRRFAESYEVQVCECTLLQKEDRIVFPNSLSLSLSVSLFPSLLVFHPY